MPDPFEIVVGTYEQYMLGYKVTNIVNEYKMEKTFATHSHSTSVRSIASNKHYLASGGADDFVCLYDLRHRVESGRLMHHNDTVNCVVFTPEASHVFTCSNDGTIAAIRCGSWQMEKQWQKPHKGLAVNALAIHPTGKVALSIGADGILRTWNLVKGRQAYATNLVPRLKLDAKNVTVLKWSPNGEKYLLAANQRIDVYSIEIAGIDNEIKLDSKIICVEFLRDDLIAIGLENGQIKFYDLQNSVETVEAVAHDIRVKCMTFKDNLLITASSSGEIKLWKYSKYKLDMLQSVNCGARITCICLAMSCKNFAVTKKIEDENKADLVVDEKEKKKKNIRLRQEVIIENEDDWEVTPIENSRRKLKKKRSKRKRSTEEIQCRNAGDNKGSKSILENSKQENDTENIDIPVKKKKLSDTGNKMGSSNKKRRENIMSTEENNKILIKKVKESNESRVETDSMILNETKKKLIELEESGDVPPKKKKKKAIAEESSRIVKKRKKKQ